MRLQKCIRKSFFSQWSQVWKKLKYGKSQGITTGTTGTRFQIVWLGNLEKKSVRKLPSRIVTLVKRLIYRDLAGNPRIHYLIKAKTCRSTNWARFDEVGFHLEPHLAAKNSWYEIIKNLFFIRIILLLLLKQLFFINGIHNHYTESNKYGKHSLNDYPLLVLKLKWKAESEYRARIRRSDNIKVVNRNHLTRPDLSSIFPQFHANNNLIVAHSANI